MTSHEQSWNSACKSAFVSIVVSFSSWISDKSNPGFSPMATIEETSHPIADKKNVIGNDYVIHLAPSTVSVYL
jgi:hypothetical protein